MYCGHTFLLPEWDTRSLPAGKVQILPKIWLVADGELVYTADFFPFKASQRSVP